MLFHSKVNVTNHLVNWRFYW